MARARTYTASVFRAAAVKGVGASRIFRSAFALMFSTVASSALGMVFWIVAARLFETEEVGRASAGVSAVSLLGGLGQLGLNTVFIRFVPLIGGAVGPFLRRTYLTSVTVTAVLAAGFVAFGFSHQFLGRGALWAVAFCVAVVGFSLSSLQDGVLTSLKRTSWVPVENVTIGLARVALLPALIATAFTNPVLVAWGLPVIGAVVVITTALFSRLLPEHRRRHAGRVRMPSRRELVQFTSASYVNGLLGNLGTYLPPVIITAVLGPAANAVFFVPWLILTVIYGLLWNISSSFVVEATSDAANTRTYLRHATRLVLLVGVGAPVVLVAGAPWLLQLLGSKYASGGVTTLRLIGLMVPFGCVTLCYTVSLLIQRRNWAIFRLNLISTIVTVPAWLIGMYRFGLNGVAAGILAADVVVALCLLPTVIRRYRALSNRSIDDDVTMIVDMKLLRAELRNEDESGILAVGARGSSTDETAVLDMAALQAQLSQHNPSGFTSSFAMLRANDQTVVLHGHALGGLTTDEATTAVLTRVVDEPAAGTGPEEDAGTDDRPTGGRHAKPDSPGHEPELGMGSRAAGSPAVGSPAVAAAPREDETFSWFTGA
jgi:O-antigen/teichoic acid export membrane protein